jgi:capsular polysaccharide transport system permease protein
VIKRTPFQIHRAVVFALVMRELKTRFGSHWSGVVWLLGEPLLKLAMMTALYTFIRGIETRGGYPFVIYLLIALLPFSLFSHLWSQLMNGARANAGLYGYKQVKPFDTIVARTVLELMLESVSFTLSFLIIGCLGYSPIFPNDLLGYLGVVFLFVAAGCGLGLVSVVAVYFSPKFSLIVALISMPLQMMSGAIFPISHFPKDMLDFLMLNPMAHLVELARFTFLPGYVMIQGVSVYYPITFIVIIWALGMNMYWVWRHKLSTSR